MAAQLRERPPLVLAVVLVAAVPHLDQASIRGEAPHVATPPGIPHLRGVLELATVRPAPCLDAVGESAAEKVVQRLWRAKVPRCQGARVPKYCTRRACRRGKLLYAAMQVLCGLPEASTRSPHV